MGVAGREFWAICLRPFHFSVACLIVANTPPNEANEGGAVWLSALELSDMHERIFSPIPPKWEVNFPIAYSQKTLSPFKGQYAGTRSWESVSIDPSQDWLELVGLAHRMSLRARACLSQASALYWAWGVFNSVNTLPTCWQTRAVLHASDIFCVWFGKDVHFL